MGVAVFRSGFRDCSLSPLLFVFLFPGIDDGLLPLRGTSSALQGKYPLLAFPSFA